MTQSSSAFFFVVRDSQIHHAPPSLARGVCGRKKSFGGVVGKAPGGGSPGGVPGKKASGGVGGGGPSGVPCDKGGVAGKGETRTPFSHLPQSCGGVVGTMSPTSARRSFLRRSGRQLCKTDGLCRWSCGTFWSIFGFSLVFCSINWCIFFQRHSPDNIMYI